LSSGDHSPGDDRHAARPSSASERGLDWLNFFIADVQTGFGPFVSLYLATLGWKQGRIGLALTVGSLAAILSQVPGGALVDAVHSKRLLVLAALVIIAIGALIFAFAPSPTMIFIAETLHGGTQGVAVPALAAIGLGLVGHQKFSHRLGRNHRYKSFGNAATAALMGAFGYFLAKNATFIFAAALCLPAAYSLSRIRGEEIDYARARSARAPDKPRDVTQFRRLFRNRRLVVFIVALFLFQFADASVMPLTSEQLGQQHQHESELITSALIAVPQVVTALIALWIARRAEDWGRKPLLLAGFGALPLRIVLFALAPNPWYLLGIQVLGGITAAVIGIMTPLVIADVTRGSGRYNLAQGAAGTATGIGAAISTGATGYIAQLFGYTIGFLALLVVALLGLGILYWLLPETGEKNADAHAATKRREGVA